MDELTIHALKNGPYIVEGPSDLFDAAGNLIKASSERIALCRCGNSGTKPLCDGTHSKIHFQAPDAVIRVHDNRER